MTFPFAPPEYAFPHNDFWAALLAEEGWAVPNLAALFGLQNTLWTLLPAVVALVLALVIVWRSVRRPERFLVGFAMMMPILGVYVALPFWRSDADLSFRRATIAERFYKPADRLQSLKLTADDDATRRKIADYEWMIAETRAFAPDDFPYLPSREMRQSPSSVMRTAAAASASGRNAEAISLLEQARESLVFARCELTANLAVVLYSNGDKEKALTELEAIKDSVTPASRPGCVRSLFLLGSLYQELGRDADAQATFTRFMSYSANINDPELLDLRRRLSAR
jgi:tetratricopeptide (TPR) repeat protein